MEALIEGKDFRLDGQNVTALTDEGNAILAMLVVNNIYPFTEYMCGLTPDSRPDRTVVNIVNYAGLMDKAREVLTTYKE